MDFLNEVIGFETGKITANECRFCHIEQAPLEIEEEILKNKTTCESEDLKELGEIVDKAIEEGSFLI